MKSDILSRVLGLVKAYNPDNHYVNNKGLASLGAIIFYPKEHEIEESNKIKQILKIFFPKDEKERAIQSKSHGYLSEFTYDEVIANLRKYHLSSYYTPENIIDFQIELLKKNNVNPKTILEPSAGSGAYVQKLKIAFPNAQIIALEPDTLSYSILVMNNKNNSNVECVNTTFEDYILSNTKKFDLVISNIPFGDIFVKNSHQHDLGNKKYINVNLFFHKFVNKILTPDGYSFLLTSKTLCDNPTYNFVREEILQNSSLVEALRFNNHLFKKENTKVVSDLIILQNKEGRKEFTEREKLFCQTSKIELEGELFNVNSYFGSNQNNINGHYKKSIFHRRYDLTIVPNDKDLDTFLKEWLESIKLNPPNISVSVSQQAISQKNITGQENKPTFDVEIITKKQDVFSKKTNQGQPITKNDVEYLKNQTKLYNSSFNFIDDKPYYISNETTFSEIKNKRQIRILDSYIPLRDEYVIFSDNLIHNRLNEEQIKNTFKHLNYQVDLFHFQHGFLKEIEELEKSKNLFKYSLNNDFYFQKLSRVFEKNNPEYNKGIKYIKNPNFKVNYFLSYSKEQKTEKTRTEKFTRATLSEKVTEESELTKTPAFYSADSLEYNTHKYYDFYGNIDLKFISELYNQPEEEVLRKGFEQKLFFLNPVFDQHNQFLRFDADLFFVLESGHIQNKINAFNNQKTPYKIDTEKVINYLESIKNEKLDLSQIEFNFESFFIPLEAKKEFFKDLVDEDIEPVFGRFQDINLIYSREYNHQADQMYSVKSDINLDDEVGRENRIKAELNYKKLFECFVENKYPIVYYTVKVGDKTERRVDPNATLIAQNKYEQLHLEFKSFVLNNAKYKEIAENEYYNYFLAENELKINKKAITFPKTLAHHPYDHQLESVLFGLSKGTALIDHKVGHGKTVSMGLQAYKLIQQKKAKTVFLATMKKVNNQLSKEIILNFPQLKIFTLNDTNFNAKNREKTLKHLFKNHYDLIIGEHNHLQRFAKDKEYVNTIYDKYFEMIEQDLEDAKKYGLKESKDIIKGIEKRKSHLEDKLNKTLEELEQKKSSVSFEELGIDALIVDECHHFKNIHYTTRHQNVAGLNNSKESNKNLDMEITINSIHQRVGKDKNVFFYSGTPIKNSVTELYAYQRYLIPSELERKNIYNFDSWASIFLKQSIQAESDIFGHARMNTRWRYFTNIPELAKMYRSFAHISDEKKFKTHNVAIKSEFKVLDSTFAYDELKEAAIEFGKNKNQEALFGYDKYDKDGMSASYITALGICRRALVDPFLEDTQISFSEEDQIKLKQVCQDAYNLYKMSDKDKGVTLIFSEIGVYKTDKYNTYNKIRETLHHQYGIPLEEIGFAQENNSKNQTAEFQQKIRSGEIRIAIGSTTTLGTGTNIQERIIGVIELDIPYSPDESEQRTGRMARAGNKITEKYNNTGYHYSYGIKNSTDIFSYALNKHKRIFIEQIKEINHKNRVYDDFFTDTKNMSYAQKEAMLIGDVDAFKLIKLEDDLKALKAQETMFQITKNNALKKITKFKSDNTKLISEISYLKKINQEFMAYVPTIGKKDTKATIEQKTLDGVNQLLFGENSQYKFQTFDQINDSILISLQNATSSKVKEYTISISPNFNFVINSVQRSEKTAYSFGIRLREKDILILGNYQYTFDKNKLAYQLFKIIKNIPEIIKQRERDFNFNLRSIDSNLKNSSAEFPVEKATQILNLEKEIKVVRSKIKI